MPGRRAGHCTVVPYACQEVIEVTWDRRAAFADSKTVRLPAESGSVKAQRADERPEAARILCALFTASATRSSRALPALAGSPTAA